MNKSIIYRQIPDAVQSDERLCENELLDKIYRARGVTTKTELEKDLKQLLAYHSLKGIEQAVGRLEKALVQQQKIVIVGDYDTDGATSTAIAMRALRALGAHRVSYLIPNRFDYGYGLSPEIVTLAKQEYQAELIITVDNGIVSLSGVEKAKELGVEVIITDHHLAGEQLPDACAIVNPNQPGDEFPSKKLAGCGVIFYVMLALRARLREQDWFAQQQIEEPNMAHFLDLVALGTIADVVPLDKNNRILVHHGVKRIRQNQCVPGIKALLELGKRDLTKVVGADLAFAVAPRLNAAGRLEDMSVGVECLLNNNPVTAYQLAVELETLNKERRTIEADMKAHAFQHLNDLPLETQPIKQRAICLHHKDWHQGVIGILASRIKDRYHRPAVIFANGDKGEIKGSARSIPGFHIRDAFSRIAARYPDIIKKYGGHAMAAGLTLQQEYFETFKKALAEDAEAWLADADLEGKVVCDSALKEQDLNLNFAQLIRESGPWGQGFPEPLFANQFKIIEQRIVGDKHLKLSLAINNKILAGILFNADLERWPNHRCSSVMAAYRVDVNEYQGVKRLQLMIEYLEPIKD